MAKLMRLPLFFFFLGPSGVDLLTSLQEYDTQVALDTIEQSLVVECQAEESALSIDSAENPSTYEKRDLRKS